MKEDSLLSFFLSLHGAKCLERLARRKGCGGGGFVVHSADWKTGSFADDVFLLRLALRKEHFSFNERRINHRGEEMSECLFLSDFSCVIADREFLQSF